MVDGPGSGRCDATTHARQMKQPARSRSIMNPAMKQALWCMAMALCLVGCASNGWKAYQARPFKDSVYRGVKVKRAGRYAVDLLYTSNRGGTISLDRSGKPLTPPISIISTKNDQDAVAWRQWHHWNVLHDAAEVDLPRGISVLTIHILTQGNMNLAFFDFRQK